jgi:hypothetical protein
MSFDISSLALRCGAAYAVQATVDQALNHLNVEVRRISFGGLSAAISWLPGESPPKPAPTRMARARLRDSAGGLTHAIWLHFTIFWRDMTTSNFRFA